MCLQRFVLVYMQPTTTFSGEMILYKALSFLGRFKICASVGDGFSGCWGFVNIIIDNDITHKYTISTDRDTGLS